MYGWWWWAVLAAVAAAAALQAAPLDAQPMASNCDGVNCWVTLPPSHGGRWTVEQRAAAVPAKLAKVEVGAHSSPVLAPAPCKAPVQINASTCLDQGLPCASMGKIYFFSPAIHAPASCSGSFITNDIVLTAGHCCMELPGVWSPDMTFFLDYDNGRSSGKYVPVEMHVPQPWQDASTRTYDWCFLKMNGTGPKHLPTSWAFDPSQFGKGGFSSFGWPADPPYDGNSLYQASGQCQGTSPTWPPSGYHPCQTPNSSAMLYMTCNTMTPGCSGGPWYDPNLGIFGLNSALILAPDQPEIYASPYFGTDFHDSCKQVGACS